MELTGGSGLRGNKRERFMGMVRSVCSAAQRYPSDPIQAGKDIAACITHSASGSGDPPWAMNEGTGYSLLGRVSNIALYYLLIEKGAAAPGFFFSVFLSSSLGPILPTRNARLNCAQ